MDDLPDVAAIARLMGDRARAAMLMRLMGGRPLTATELSRTARVTKQTTSSHLAKLVEARLVAAERHGRHRYFRLADHDVGLAIERLAGLAKRVGAMRTDAGPADAVLRRARVCYDHLAGELGVLVFDGLVDLQHLRAAGDAVSLTEQGARWGERLGIDVATLARGRRPLCLTCLDWSMRRHHLAGALGAAILRRCFELRWAYRHRSSRAVVFSATGERSLLARLRDR